MSVQRGVDPKALTLASFGGAGALHVCALAEALDMQQAIVPIHAGVLSALGMLVAPRARFHSLTVNQLLPENEDEKLLSRLQHDFEKLAEQGRSSLLDGGLEDSIGRERNSRCNSGAVECGLSLSWPVFHH